MKTEAAATFLELSGISFTQAVKSGSAFPSAGFQGDFLMTLLAAITQQQESGDPASRDLCLMECGDMPFTLADTPGLCEKGGQSQETVAVTDPELLCQVLQLIPAQAVPIQVSAQAAPEDAAGNQQQVQIRPVIMAGGIKGELTPSDIKPPEESTTPDIFEGIGGRDAVKPAVGDGVNTVKAALPKGDQTAFYQVELSGSAGSQDLSPEKSTPVVQEKADLNPVEEGVIDRGTIVNPKIEAHAGPEKVSRHQVKVTAGETPPQAGGETLTDVTAEEVTVADQRTGSLKSGDRAYADVSRLSGSGTDTVVKGTEPRVNTVDLRAADETAAAGSGEKAAVKPASGLSGEGNEWKPGGNAAGDEWEIPFRGSEGAREEVIKTVTAQVSAVTSRKFPALVMTHLAGQLSGITRENGRVTVIRIKLEPENMGEIKIRLSYSKGELTAHFFTSSGIIRDAVEGSLPQLRDALAQYNVNLGEAAAYLGQGQHGQGGSGLREFGYRPGEGFPGGVAGEGHGESPRAQSTAAGRGTLDLLI